LLPAFGLVAAHGNHYRTIYKRMHRGSLPRAISMSCALVLHADARHYVEIGNAGCGHSAFNNIPWQPFPLIIC
jgi:hypothetical protein